MRTIQEIRETMPLGSTFCTIGCDELRNLLAIAEAASDYLRHYDHGKVATDKGAECKAEEGGEMNTNQALAILAKICRDNIAACESGKRRPGCWTGEGVQGELAGVIAASREVLAEIRSIRKQNRKAGTK